MVCASTIAKGGADLGCGCQSGAAGIAGVDFIPLQPEWYDFVFRLADKKSPALTAVLSYLESGEFQQDLQVMGGYDTSQTGHYREF
jgi:putative molybdopterin biosynthesis protein